MQRPWGAGVSGTPGGHGDRSRGNKGEVEELRPEGKWGPDHGQFMDFGCSVVEIGRSAWPPPVESCFAPRSSASPVLL